VIVGGGHNALVAAALLGRAGCDVTVLERRDEPGGAAVSGRPFPGVDVQISRFAYLVSLLPDVLLAQLGAAVELRRRPVASCTPDGPEALVVEDDATRTRRSFEAVGAAADLPAFTLWQAQMRAVAGVVAPTLLQPLRPAADFAAALGPQSWELIAERPLGASLRERFASDLVRGVLLTDGLIGTLAHSEEPSLRQNRCFLYHVIGNGTGEWNVPVRGMGAVRDALADAARAAGVRMVTGAEVVSVEADGRRGLVTTADGSRVESDVVLCGAAPAVLDGLLGRATSGTTADGAQVKVNMVVRRLPRLSSGVAPEVAFAGTLHVHERHSELDAAYADAGGGRLPDPIPCEVYCHSLTDPTILGPELRGSGAHTLSLFALHTPARLFEANHGTSREQAGAVCLRALQSVLAEPLDDVLLPMPDGRPCVEVHTPLDVEAELAMPRGNIFHGDLQWPWAEDDADVGRWGSETDIANLFLCGSGVRRGGAVSGLGGHAGAMAALEFLARRGQL